MFNFRLNPLGALCLIGFVIIMISGCCAQFQQEVEIVKRYKWGSDCPSECQCHLTAPSRTTLSKWLPPQDTISSTIKVAVCVLQQSTLVNKMFRRLPKDTQILTILQTQEAPPVVLMEANVEHLDQLLALEIRAHSHYQFALGSDSLRPLRRLRYLQLKGVDLSALPVGLTHLRSLRHLSLHDNQLDHFPKDSFSSLNALEEMELSNNGIREIPPLAFVELSSLKKIRLQGNRLHALDANSFVGLDHLILLDLSHNNISDVSMISFPPLPHLLWLHLSDNPIRVLFLNAFHFLNTTRQVTLGHPTQSMHIMKYSFAGLHSVESLLLPNVDNHVLEKDIFQGLLSLKSLTIRGQTRIISAEAFYGANILENLVLRNGQIRRVASGAFKGLKYLRTLDLSHNSISKLPLGVFEGLKSLKELQLQNNGLHFFPVQLTAHIRLHMLRLENNPWHCTCAMAKWDRSALARVRVDTCININQQLEMELCRGKMGRDRYVREPSLRPVCNSPPEVKGKRVFEALRKNLHCFPNKNYSKLH
ncbi:hypothetical protein CHUAL_002033 [Chamberlinius hualienensis]